MFNNPLPLPGYSLPEPSPSGDPWTGPVPAIRLQAREIIEEILRSADAVGSEARELLRQRVVQMPFPERAEEVLLAHLTAMASLNNPGFPVPGHRSPEPG
jgi:hypothetical protein